MRIHNLLILSFLATHFAAAAVDIPKFLEIEPQLYRSGRPNKDALKWLKDEHQIKTIISLEDSDSVVNEERSNAAQLGINFYNFPMSASKDPQDEVVNQVLDLMAQSNKRPLLVHCKHGRDRTGMIVGIYHVEDMSWSSHDSYQDMLDNGFRTMFYKLDRYYKNRTHYNGMPAQDLTSWELQ